jgi:zinc transport system substrate-binding protein
MAPRTGEGEGEVSGIRRFLGALLAGALVNGTLLAGMAAAADPVPRVVTTIKPVHALATAVMAGVGRPELLLRGTASPHAFTLKAAEIRLVNAATIVAFVGEALETFIVRALENVPSEVRVVELVAADGLRLLPQRLGPPWMEEESRSSQVQAGGSGPGTEDPDSDPHIWLDPQNARAIAGMLADELIDADPGRAATYAANLKALADRLAMLDQDIARLMAEVKAAPFLVLHDAYQYFENRYGLTASGAITRRPEVRPSPRRIAEAKARLAESGAVCVFGEAQFPQAHAKAVADGTPAKFALLDPLGASQPETAEAYFGLMRALAEGFRGCLGRKAG